MTTRVAGDNQRAAELLRSAAAKLGPAANPATVAMANAVADSIDPPRRACYFCGKVLDARAGFIETIHQPDGLRRDFCSAECLHWQTSMTRPTVVGVDYDSVTFGYGQGRTWCLTKDQAEEFASLFLAAYWQAGRNAERMAMEASE